MLDKSKDFLLAIVFVFIVPSILFSILISQQSTQVAAPTFIETHSVIQTDAVDTWTVRLLKDNNNIVILPLEEYVLGVVLKEMPADFGIEALKAQAVAVRTYTLRRCMQSYKHNNADVCSDPSCCQAYLTEEAYILNGGSVEKLNYIREAVAATNNVVLLYNGQLIESTYFSSSGGMTEDAVAVWGSNVPYLQATVSPGEEKSTHHITTEFIEITDFAEALCLPESDIKEPYIQDIHYTDGGGIESVMICGKEFTGLELRKTS